LPIYFFLPDAEAFAVFLAALPHRLTGAAHAFFFAAVAVFAIVFTSSPVWTYYLSEKIRYASSNKIGMPLG
jgi:hypothetical protein